MIKISFGTNWWFGMIKRRREASSAFKNGRHYHHHSSPILESLYTAGLLQIEYEQDTCYTELLLLNLQESSLRVESVIEFCSLKMNGLAANFWAIFTIRGA